MEVPGDPPSALERYLVGWMGRNVFLRGRRAGPWPVPAALRYEAFRFPGNTGASLAARWFPAADARGAAVLVHPDRRYAQHWFVREGWVAFLLHARFHVLTFDLPFYGETRGGATYYPEDVLAAAAEARRRHAGPVHVVGLSQGAFAAANAAPALDVEGLVLESPYPSYTAWYGDRRGAFVSRLFDRAFPRSVALIDAVRNLSRARARRILVAAAGADRTTPPALSLAVARGGPAARTTYLELPGVEHLALFRDSPRYREAVLATLGVGPDEAAELAAGAVARLAQRAGAAAEVGRAPLPE